MGKWRRPRPINRHTPTVAAGCWGPRRSALALWLRLEAKSERALGPGATVGVLGTGVPRLACLRPTAWLSQQAVRPIFINKASKTLARGQASRGGRRKTSPGAASLGWLPRSGDIYARCTSRGSRDVSHDVCQAQDAILSRSRDTYVIGAQPHFGRLARWISLHRSIT